MKEKEQLMRTLMDVLGEEGCGMSCEEATLFKDEEGWKMMLEGFMEPWKLGKTVAEAESAIREYASDSGRGAGVPLSSDTALKCPCFQSSTAF